MSFSLPVHSSLTSANDTEKDSTLCHKSHKIDTLTKCRSAIVFAQNHDVVTGCNSHIVTVRNQDSLTRCDSDGMPAKGMDGMTSPKSPDNQISINDNAEGGISISAADEKENEDLKDGTNSTLNNMKTPKLPKTTAKEKPRKRLATKTKTSTAAKPKTKASQRIKPRYVPLFTSPLLSTIGRTASATTNNLEPPIGGSSHPVTAKIGQLNPE